MHAIRASILLTTVRHLRPNVRTIRQSSSDRFWGPPPSQVQEQPHAPSPSVHHKGNFKRDLHRTKDLYLRQLATTSASGAVGEFLDKLRALIDDLGPEAKHDRKLAANLAGMVGNVIDKIDTNPRQASNCLYSMGALGFNVRFPGHRELILKAVHKLCAVDNPPGMVSASMGLIGLFTTGVKLSDLPVEQRAHVLLALIEHGAEDLPPRNLATVLKALGILGESWHSIPPSTQQALWRNFEKNAAQMVEPADAQYGARVVNSFGHLGLDDKILSDGKLELVLQIARSVLSVSEQCADPEACKQTALTISGIGMMKLPFASLPVDLQDLMMRCLVTTLPMMRRLSVADVIYAFKQMGCSWATISPALQAAFQGSCLAMLSAGSPFLTSSSLHGIAGLGVKWTMLTPELQEKAEHAVVAISRQDMDENLRKQVCFSVISLGKMDAPWSSFSSDFHSTALNAFASLDGSSILRTRAKFISGLGNMGAPFQDVVSSSPGIKQAMDMTLHSLANSSEGSQPFYFSRCLSGFAKMGALWRNLPGDMLERWLDRVAVTLSEQEVADSMHSLSIMEVSWHALSSDSARAITSALEAGAPTMNSQAVASSMYGLTLMCFDFQSTNMGSPAELEKEQLMWRMIRAQVKRFRLLGREEYGTEEITQFAIFFEWLSVLPGGKEMLTKELDSRPEFPIIVDASRKSPLPPKRSDRLTKFLAAKRKF